jgi:hypothetical protein
MMRDAPEGVGQAKGLRLSALRGEKHPLFVDNR